MARCEQCCGQAAILSKLRDRSLRNLQVLRSRRSTCCFCELARMTRALKERLRDGDFDAHSVGANSINLDLAMAAMALEGHSPDVIAFRS
jgi:hypothetical protein